MSGETDALSESTISLRLPHLHEAADALTRLAVCAGVRLYREGLGLALRGVESIDVVALVADADAENEKLAAADPDVVLVDATGPDGIEQVRHIVAGLPYAKVVAIAIPESEESVLACAEAGVHGYLTRDSSLSEVAAMLESVAHDELLCSPRIAASLMRRVHSLSSGRPKEDSRDRLTRREEEVLDLLAEGLSNKQIAGRLSIELPTVKNHVHNILEKLGVARRGEAAMAARLDPRRVRI
jgi:DNA-binding NarL/FixJ family response regulator